MSKTELLIPARIHAAPLQPPHPTAPPLSEINHAHPLPLRRPDSGSLLDSFLWNPMPDPSANLAFSFRYKSCTSLPHHPSSQLLAGLL